MQQLPEKDMVDQQMYMVVQHMEYMKIWFINGVDNVN